MLREGDFYENYFLDLDRLKAQAVSIHITNNNINY